jgi:hypothetical protein
MRRLAEPPPRLSCGRSPERPTTKRFGLPFLAVSGVRHCFPKHNQTYYEDPQPQCPLLPRLFLLSSTCAQSQKPPLAQCPRVAVLFFFGNEWMVHEPTTIKALVLVKLTVYDGWAG